MDKTSLTTTALEQHVKRITLNGWGLLAAGAFLAGCFFRVYGLGRQIPLDDEWHGMFSAGTQTFRYLATHLMLSGASIPYSLYRRLCLVTVGWDEVVLRLPSLIAGLAALIACPWSVRRALKDRAAALFVFLLAVSPLLIYYSRYSRVYSITMLLQFACIFSFYFWVTARDRSSRLVFIGSAALGAYFHFFCIVPLAACFFFWMFLASPFVRRLLRHPRAAGAPGAKEGLFVFGAAGTLIVLLYLPSLLNGSFFEMFLIRLHEPPQSGSGILFSVVMLASGSAHKVVLPAMAGLAVAGAVRLYRADRLLTGLLACAAACVCGAILLMLSRCSDSGLTVVRYAIVLVPLYLLLVALGLEGLWGLLKRGAGRLFGGTGGVPASAALLGVLSCYVLTGPLLPVYGRVNNFPHHNAFQQDYRNIGSGAPYRDDYFPACLALENISPFYVRLACEPGPFSILEYPMFIGNYFNFHYYYQQLHQKDIIAGYLAVLKPHGPRPHPTMVYGNLIFDYYLNDMCCRDRLRFNNLVDILDLEAIKDRGIRYIILHEDAMREGFGQEGVLVLSEYPFFEKLRDEYERHFGGPVYADRWITVFSTQGPLK